MTAAPTSEDLCSPAERTRLEALAGEIERLRALGGPADPAAGGLRDRPPAEWPLDWERLGAAAREIAQTLVGAGVLAAPDAVRPSEQLADPTALGRLIGWGLGGRVQPPPFDRAALTWEVVRLALPPFLQPHDGQRVDTDDSRTCPACGGVPDLAVLASADGARMLTCSVCDTSWRFDRVRCPFCGSAAQDTLAYLGGGPRGYSIRVCDACQTYVKTLDRRERPGRESALLLRMLTVEMDRVALAAGYHAPSGAPGGRRAAA